MRARLADAPFYYGWIVVAACFVGSFVVFGVSYSFGVFFDAILEAFGGSRAGTSLVFSVGTFVTYIGAAVVGGLVDRYGARRLLIAGAALLGVGLAGAAWSRALWQVIVLYGVVASLGLSAIYVVAYATVPRWFERRRGFATGVATAGLGVGMLVVSPLSAELIVRWGWRTAYLALLAASLALLAGAAALIADRPQGVGADAADEFDGEPPDPAPERSWRGQIADTVSVARTPSFVLVLVGWIGIYTTLYVVFAHLVVFATGRGLPRWVGVWGLATIGGVTTLARLGIGLASDRVGRVRTFVACSAVMGASTLALAGLDSAPGILAFAVVYGAAYGGNGALLSPLTADLFGTENLNVLFGLVSVSFAVSGLLAPPAAGLAYDALATYTPAFAASGALGLVGTGLVAWAGRREGAL